MSSFFLYSADNRYEVRRQLGYVGYTPFSAGTEIAKELGRMWRNEDAETKAYYKEISLRNFAKYKTDMEAYNNREFAWHILVKTNSFLGKGFEAGTYEDYWTISDINKKLANTNSIPFDFLSF